MAISQLRVAVFTSQAPWGKSESFVLTEIAELRRLVEAVLVIPVRPGSALFHGELARRIGQYTIRLPVINPMILGYVAAATLWSPRRVGQAFAEIIKGATSFRVLMKNLAVFPKAVYVARLIRQFGAHHIHAHWASVPATMALVVSRLTGVSWSFTAYRWDIAEDNLLRAKLLSASFARVASLGGQNEILDITGVRECQTLFTIHTGTEVLEDGGALCLRSDREFSIGCMANLVEKKGHCYLIEACRLLQQRGWRFICHIVGDGPLRESLEALVREYGLHECVRLWGAIPHDEVIRMLRRREIDLVVLPSIHTMNGEREGIPNVLVEALAHRVPTISTTTGEIPELLGDGAGVLVKPADAGALADAIQLVMEDSAYSESLVETGFARVSADFNIRTVAERLVTLMEGFGGIG
ncbi:hypothetical protein CLG94_12420 [Candidatus Methylomirabilis limnetica]|uniref:Glycosyl transferase family 1 domain-containing protein n=1 Tax=Candidatus Methylomirabilis limnetica TaxID=2033718 RepID=A0A2T4TUV8_9BACT|nr:glycosyltransferase [Candidatus Methylomirabilis limnetica]PTL34896.1 hypothetical protein CLG94_12420 [Candidatus Methylomirabilis limnetica]